MGNESVFRIPLNGEGVESLADELYFMVGLTLDATNRVEGFVGGEAVKTRYGDDLIALANPGEDVRIEVEGTSGWFNAYFSAKTPRLLGFINEAMETNFERAVSYEDLGAHLDGSRAMIGFPTNENADRPPGDGVSYDRGFEGVY